MRSNRATVRVVGPLDLLILPALACLLATLVMATPIRLFGLPPPEPVFPMILAFAWPLIRPSMLGPIALLGVGLVLDLFWGGPLGLWTLALLGVYGAVLAGRSFIIGQDLPVLLFWYVGLVSGAFLFAYLFVMLDVQMTPSLPGVLMQLGVTLLLFPLTYWLVQRFDDGDVRFR
jgi:rod shape-determining protein MreD